MKKIMFNDKYGLTQAVLEGLKTMTRRIVPHKLLLKYGVNKYNQRYADLCKDAPYKIGEIVAIAQAYETLAHSGTQQLRKMMENPSSIKKEYCGAGWNNKMFVAADLMPHQIRITNIKVERLQDISDIDCAKEGVRHFLDYRQEKYARFYIDAIPNYRPGKMITYDCVKDAFAALIDKVSGNGTWDSNPWVFVYEFELVK